MRLHSLTALPLLCASLAMAETFEQWGQSGDWTILIDPSAGNGCLMEKTFENETVIQIGAVPKRRGGFLAAYNRAWEDIEEGFEGVLRIDFGDALFEGSAIGKIHDGIPGGYAFFDNPEFINEFRKRDTLILTGKKSGHRVEIDLTGTSKGLNAVQSCQKEQPTN